MHDVCVCIYIYYTLYYIHIYRARLAWLALISGFFDFHPRPRRAPVFELGRRQKRKGVRHFLENPRGRKHVMCNGIIIAQLDDTTN